MARDKLSLNDIAQLANRLQAASIRLDALLANGEIVEATTLAARSADDAATLQKKLRSWRAACLRDGLERGVLIDGAEYVRRRQARATNGHD